jgi:hypothetical protein
VTFKIITQVNPVLGCIPACARSVLEEAGIPAPTEIDLVDAMYHPGVPGSGFTKLTGAFKSLRLKHEVKIEYPSPLDVAGRVVELNRLGLPVLFPRTTPALHCFVAFGCSADEAVLHNPGDGKEEIQPWDTARATWTGDIAYIFIVPPEGALGSLAR